ncbi:MAG: hypothetical protein AB8I08_17160 [Sandaracinaceae bacterium]
MRKLKPWLWGFAIGLLALAPVLREWNRSGWGDWRQFHHWWEVGRLAVLRYGEFPLFDPHHCGGVPMWGQPQMQYLAPTWWVTGFAFGTIHGHKLFMLLHHVVGFAGMYIVARRIARVRTVGAVLAALAWAYGGYFAWRGAGGHATFFAFHYIPLIFYCWRKTDRDVRYAGGVAGLMGLQLLEGGTYPFPLTFLVIAFDFVVRLPRTRWRLVRTAALTGTLTALIGAIRLWPIYATMSRFPRETRMEDAMTFNDVLTTLTSREPNRWIWGHRWVWAEYGSFVGWTVVVLGALGALVAMRRSRHRHLALGLVLFGACAMGNVAPLWPWPLLHELPVFGNLHVPSRFMAIVTFYLALLSGLALDRGLRWVQRVTLERRTQVAMVALAWLLVLTVGIDVVTNTTRVLTRWVGADVSGEPAARFHLVSNTPYLPLFMHYPQRNIGTTGCYDPVPWDLSDSLWTGDVPQARVLPEASGEVTETQRTNYTFTADVTLSEPARVVFNQNFDPDWGLSMGEPVDDEGRLAVDLPAGTHQVVATYWPPDLPWSALLCLLGLLGSVLLLRLSPARLRARRQRAPEPALDDVPDPRLPTRMSAALRRAFALWRPDGQADRHTLRTAQQHAAAARGLRANGHDAGALELAEQAFRATVAASGESSEAGLARWGLSRRHRSAIRAVTRALEATVGPALDEEATPEHRELTDSVLALTARIDRHLAPSVWTPRERRRQRASRFGALAAALLSLVGATAWFQWPRHTFEVRASGARDAQVVAANLVDANNDTEWLLPDGEPGWVEFELSRPRRIERVRLRNAHNDGLNNRATDAYTLQLFVDGEVAFEEEGRWEEFDPDPVWFDHTIGVDRVERIRVEIRSHHRRGAGLSEIDWN